MSVFEDERDTSCKVKTLIYINSTKKTLTTEVFVDINGDKTRENIKVTDYVTNSFIVYKLIFLTRSRGFP